MTGSSDHGLIALMGPFGYGNLGDAAIVDSAIQWLRARDPSLELRGFSLNPGDTEARHGIASHPLSRMSWEEDEDETPGLYRRVVRRLGGESPLLGKLERVALRGPAEFGMLVRAFRSLRGVDALIVCGSGQLQDYWGGGGAWSYPYTMLRWGLLARMRGARFVVLSVGAGPVDSRLSRAFFRWALSLAEYRSYRDEWSRQFVAETIGFDRGDPVVPDLAFGLDVGHRRSEPLPDHVAGRDRVIGIGPMGYFRPGSWPEADTTRWLAYRDAMVEFISWLIARGDAVLFLKGEAYHDQPVVDEIVAELVARGVPVGDHIVDTPVTTVDELIHALARCDLVVASRFHNVLLAYRLGIPVLGISYQSKTDSLMEEYGQSAFCLPINELSPTTLESTASGLEGQEGFGDRAKAITAAKRAAVVAQFDRIIPVLRSDRRGVSTLNS